jgi:hypothetical protein
MATKKKTAARKASPKRATTTTKAAATEKAFKDDREAALRGLPPDVTVEQLENHARRQVLGY